MSASDVIYVISIPFDCTYTTRNHVSTPHCPQLKAWLCAESSSYCHISKIQPGAGWQSEWRVELMGWKY